MNVFSNNGQQAPKKRGDLVQYWFDTGAMGAAILYGEVIAAGPKAFRVRWESDNTNRVAQGDSTVKLAEDQEGARKACSRNAPTVAQIRAAAPEVFEALLAAVAFVELSTGNGTRQPPPSWAIKAGGEFDAEEIARRGRAAIAKAKAART